MPTPLPNKINEDQRTHRGWAVSIFVGCTLVVGCLLGFLATHQKAAAWGSGAAQAEFVGLDPQPASPDPVQLAARKPIK